MPNSNDFQEFTGLSAAALAISGIIGLAVFVIMLIAYTNVISRAGYSRWWILIMLVPLVNIVMLLIFCFKEWPMQRELRELRQFRAQSQGGYGQSGGYQPPGYPQTGGYPAQGGYPETGGYPAQGGYPQQGGYQQ